MEATYLDFERIIDGFSKSEKLIQFMTGILLVDARRNASKKFIIESLDQFNTDSGEYIDFYMPGYVKETQKNVCDCVWTDEYRIEYRGEEYFFQPDLFERECKKYEREFRFKYDKFPTLIMLDMERIGQNEYAEMGRYRVVQSMVIMLSKYIGEDSYAIEKLFNKIFEYAKENTSMRSLQYHFRFRVLLGHHMPKIKEFLINQGFAALVAGAQTMLSNR